MDADRNAGPDDIAALKEALAVEPRQGFGDCGRACGSPREGVGRQRTDRPSEAPNRQAKASYMANGRSVRRG